MTDDSDIYRLLQQHLDQQPVGFPATRQGADLRLLQRLFTTDEAKLALHLSYKPTPVAAIAERAGAEFPDGQMERLLDSLLMKGAIGRKTKEGVYHWHLLPLWLGMYEAQDGQPTPEFVADADAYMQSMEYKMSIFAVRPSQMRTIPINKSIDVEHHIATYDRIRVIIEKAPGPFVILQCTCRQVMLMKDKPCAHSSRSETCLIINDMAENALCRGRGREITRQEVLEILEQNENDGLVLQTANEQEPEFICSCCGCCCGWLRFQKSLPRPSEHWTSSFSAEVSSEDCARCGECVARCQVNAITLPEQGSAVVELGRCIGCGLCIPTCSPGAIQLKNKTLESIPPKTREELNDKIQENRNIRRAVKRR
jgi:electron transport complex protein RnfB